MAGGTLMHGVKTLLIVAVVVFGGSALTQTARQAPKRETDPVAALTAEFRALRAELSAANAASLRLQMLIARLQAQEQRLIYLDRLRSEAATRRSNAEQGRNELARRFGQFNYAEAAKLGPEERRHFELAVESEKSQLALQERTVRQMQVEETDAVNDLAQEQGRWNDFNARLDELERSLSQR
jgi:hypothetical protein